MHAAFFWAVLGLSLVVVSRVSPLLRCVGLSLQWLLWFPSTGSRRTGSVAVEQTVGPQHVGSSWTRNRTGSPALPGGFLTTGPPGKPSEHSFVVISYGIEREQNQILRLIPNLERPSLATWSGVTHTLPTSHWVLPFCFIQCCSLLEIPVFT